MNSPLLPAPWRVRKVRRETGDTFSLEMVAPAGNGFTFSPGQFNMLTVFGVGEIPVSISGDPADPGTLVHTTRAVGAVTRAMSRLRGGDELGLRGPFGTSWPVRKAEGGDVVIVAGGIGLAPLRPAIHEVISRRSSYGRVILLYGARTPEDLLYAKDLARWRKDFGVDAHVTVDRATRDWKGDVGVVTKLIPRAPFQPDRSRAWICGPEVMMRYTVLELLRRGIPEANVSISMERNMKCAVGFCGHCQFGPSFVCKDGPVFPYAAVRDLLSKRET
ncbi:MAG: Ni/Fe hydrogenase subunit gamma [Elusimicrobia bacterium RIFCSPLOWO2_01_FULL_64_13]|nr:MAG: Ni/Fe hydrogenase subunit gamma [Elusimicrobia bacterium RIFCSPHIGHO2_01_FULL_64_10]OGR97824.1 MAG: Ni/Fe hydrogenase subunit gamma [Elusimicrobia bacterium RIFCSPLOWO2_01_FULL_64_13]